MLAWLAGWILAGVWLSRLLDAARGMPTLADITQPEWDRFPDPGPRVTVIVPARDEEAHLEPALRSLLALEYPNCEVIAVNDRSRDRTGEIMEQVAAEARTRGRKFLVGHVRDLPPGWLGKTHAMCKAAQQATGDWLLFTDADVVFRPDSLRRAIAYAEHSRADHVVLLPTVLMETVGERMMQAFFSLMFVFGHRPWKVSDPKTRDSIGFGAFNLVRRSAYEKIGAHQALRMAVVDDMWLGELIKRAGLAQRAVNGPDLISLRWCIGAMGMVRNLTKNMFAVMRFSYARALGACTLGAFLNLGPFLGTWLARGWAKSGFVVALLAIAGFYARMRRARIPPLYFFLHPVSATLFLYAMLRSMAHTAWHRGVVWRGTKYPLQELRQGMLKG